MSGEDSRQERGQKKFITGVAADQVILLDKKIKITEEGAEDVTKEELPF